jgi:hypothetical protein
MRQNHGKHGRCRFGGSLAFSVMLTAMGDRSAGYTVGGASQTAHSYGFDDLAGLFVRFGQVGKV